VKSSCHSSSIAKNLRAKVISNTKVALSYYKMTLGLGSLSRTVAPGHFFNIKCGSGPAVFLRRPFSVHRIKSGGNIEILYEVIGGATTLLSRKKKGELLDIIGPLGNEFPINSANGNPQTAILVAGGMGVAPLVALAEGLSKAQGRGLKIAIVGARTKEEILCGKDFKNLGFKVIITTEDGSEGKKALATTLLKDALSAAKDKRRATIYTCGPNPMLREIAKIAGRNKVKAFGSFEEHMACGVGNCYGCTIKTNQGYRRVCKDGPVFDLREIAW